MKPSPVSSLNRAVRVAIVATHPIQYDVQGFRCLARQSALRIRVFYGSRNGSTEYYDAGMGRTIKWHIDLLSGYEHEFLRAADEEKQVDRPLAFRKCNVEEALESFKPDVVVGFGYSTLLPLRALLYCKRKRVPFLMKGDSELLRVRSFWKRAIKRAILPRIYENVAAFVSMGDNNSAYYTHYGVPREKIFPSSYIVSDTQFHAVRENKTVIREQIRKELQLAPETVIALWVGKLIDRKRPLDLAYATRLVHARGGGLLCSVFAGSGDLGIPLAQVVKDMPKNSCRLLGFVNVDKLPSLYGAADFLVHSADSDPHPLSTVEASFAGLPIIASDRVGSVGKNDNLRIGENAIIYPAGVVAALADAMRFLVSDPQARAMMGQESIRIMQDMDRRFLQGYLDAIRFACRLDA